MLKTEHYQLNKPEVTDPLRLADFNANADIIDGALAAMAASVRGKGNCRIAFGSYVGTGTYGATRPVTLDVGFCPVLVAVGSVDLADRDTSPTILIKGCTAAAPEYGTEGDSLGLMQVTWGDTQVTWYNENHETCQCNDKGRIYYYVVLGCDT